MEKPKITFEAFQVLMTRWHGWIMHHSLDHPRSFEDWVLGYLNWLGYSQHTLKTLSAEDLSTRLVEQYPGLFDPDFDVDKYYDTLTEEIAEANGEIVSDVKRRALALV